MSETTARWKSIVYLDEELITCIAATVTDTTIRRFTETSNRLYMHMCVCVCVCVNVIIVVISVTIVLYVFYCAVRILSSSERPDKVCTLSCSLTTINVVICSLFK